MIKYGFCACRVRVKNNVTDDEQYDVALNQKGLTKDIEAQRGAQNIEINHEEQSDQTKHESPNKHGSAPGGSQSSTNYEAKQNTIDEKDFPTPIDGSSSPDKLQVRCNL